MVYYKPKALICLFLYAICCNNVTGRNVPVYKHKGPFYHHQNDYVLVIPKKIDSDKNFHSHYIPHYYKHSSADADYDHIHYLIPIDGDDKHLELVPNRKVAAPGYVLETLNGDGSRQMKGLNENQCHYVGRIRDEKDSRAALSTCDGLAGYVRTKKGIWMIEPLERYNYSAGGPHPHKVYRRDMTTINNNKCGDMSCPEDDTENVRFDLSDEESTNPYASNRTNSTMDDIYVESLVVLDHSIIELHKDHDVENFVFTIFNLANDLLYDKSLCVTINLQIVRMIRLEPDNYELNTAFHRNPVHALDLFCKWQNKINPLDDNHPNHHDVAILITRIDVCSDEKTCGILGAARYAGICDPLNSAIICQDNGLRMGFTIAHQLGHTMGINHDPNTPPTHLDPNGNTYLMQAHVNEIVRTWSNNSAKALLHNIGLGMGTCLYDLPSDHRFVLVDVEPGVMYDGDYQCREIFGPNAALCMTGLECNNLICYVKDKGCVETKMRPAQGTRCGTNKWCFNGECTVDGERPHTIDGGWGPWSAWSTCTRSCDSGVMMQVRRCNNPIPANGGKYCIGERHQYRICSTEPCDLKEMTFRDLQCSSFNTMLSAHDGKLHKWRSAPVNYENLCALHCVNEMGNVETLRPKVIDGTSCYRTIRDICVNGVCKEIPCDLDLQSTAVEDRCGVCKGDGTSCEIVHGKRHYDCSILGDQEMMVIPAGAINIKIEETLPSETLLQVKDQRGFNTFISGDSLGMFDVLGATAWMGMIRPKQEAISMPGPTLKPISIWVNVQQNSTIRFMYGVKAQHKRKPFFTWDYLGWSRCSAECGPGSQEALVKCVEKDAGLVDESHCKNFTRLPPQVRPCEIAICKAKWFMGDWSVCAPCPWGMRSRLVKCYHQIGEGEGEYQFLADISCKRPRPKPSEPCVCDNTDKMVNTMLKKEKQQEKSGQFCDDDSEETVSSHDKSIQRNISTIIDYMSIPPLHFVIHHGWFNMDFKDSVLINDTVSTMDGFGVMKFLNTLHHRDRLNNNTRI